MRLLLPGVVVAFAVKLAFPGEMSRQTGLTLNDIAHAYLYPYDNPMRELWFIATLFWLMVLSPLWQWVLKGKWSEWVCLAVLVVLHFWHPEIELLCIGKVFSHAIWFYMGLLICKENLVETVLNREPWLTLLMGIGLYVLGKYTNPFITTIGGITFSFGLALMADKWIPRLFFSFRNYTYQIFLMGIFVQIAVKIAYRHVTMPYIFAFVLCVIAGLYVPVMISKVIERLNWKPLKLCVGLK